MNPIGSFCLVLHGHLPYVLRHGMWPHGEDWLYEAAAETYLPLLDVIGECLQLGVQPHFTLGLTPVLLEQLSHEHFKDGFERYLHDRIDQARQDRREYETASGLPDRRHMVYLADRWSQQYGQLAEQFRRIRRDIPAAFAQHACAGQIQILSSAATHGYFPLLYEDSSIRAQIRAGLASSQRILGFTPTGFWLPECAYRPGGPWQPPNGWSGRPNRCAVENLLADEGVTHFFVENHLIEGCRSEFVGHGDTWAKVDWDEAARSPQRGWRSVNEPHEVNSDADGPRGITALTRDPQICHRVWSGDVGYPANGLYLEFHKRWSPKRGLRYWRVTDAKLGLGDKHPYRPDDIAGKIHEHAQHFCQSVRQRLRDHHRHTGRHGVVTACFDAELFGHWWFEGPRFLRDVILTLNAQEDVRLSTTQHFLDEHPPDKAAALPEGSWGEEGDHRVWANDRVNWMWDIEYRCESQFGKLTYELPWQRDPALRALLEKAGRQLLLLQASDWPFAVTRGQAVDYGIQRFMLHVRRFETLTDLCEKAAANPSYLDSLNAVEKHQIQDADLHDIIFPQVDLDWWSAAPTAAACTG